MSSEAQSDSHRSLEGRPDNRVDRRMAIRLPVECRREDEDIAYIVRTVTENISTGGLYLELDSPDFQVGDRIHVELTMPPAEGVSPFQGRATSLAEVLRVQGVGDQDGSVFPRYGLAARFIERLRLSY